MFDYYHSREQNSRELQAIDELRNQKDPNGDAYSAGEFDSIVGLEPNRELLTNQYYWSGYQSKQYQYYCKKYGIKLEFCF